VPVIVFTSSQNPKERARAMELGVKEYLTKPMGLDDYINTIRTATNTGRRNYCEWRLGWFHMAVLRNRSEFCWPITPAMCCCFETRSLSILT
jgi:DNA-binding NarL/FixJ family response regulator